ncbi:energy-coupling factor ABC transporter ATP-binding protein [Barrientosiimonas marina]|uniref:Energy-coupling factor transporter ATP-binding protein EcfA2 n=1 Tax=Lentibacillus kimchii TaxID=1542911 RepID=A0ABW2UX75_9BACI
MDITFKDVSYIYQDKSPFAHKALADFSCAIPSGSFTAIIGHTGSGKSTLIQHLNGLVRPTKGEVVMGDYHLTPHGKPGDMKTLRSHVGVVFQYPEHQLFEETVRKDIAFGPKNFGVAPDVIDKRIDEVVAETGLSHELLERSPFDLSGGQMRRAAIAGVLATKPDVLVLDEPTAGLDPRGQRDMMAMFYDLHQEENLTTILVTHSMEDAVKYADNVIILNNGGKYMEGKPEDVLTQKEALHDVQLDVPEIVQFINAFNDRFNQNITFRRQSAAELAEEMRGVLKGDSPDE